MDLVRIGIIGSGYMARTYAETTTKFNKGTRLVAIAGGRRAPALAANYNIAAEPSVEALIRRGDVDAVILAMPEQARLAYTQLAAAAGKHVLSEKPMAPTVADCTAMIEACHQAGVNLMVVKTSRYRGVQARAKALIDAGRIGRVWMMHSLSTATQADYRDAARDKPWLTDPAGGGFFYDQAAHNFDMMRWLTGQEAKRIFANVTTYSNLPWPALSALVQVEFDGGATAQLTVCLEMPETTFPASAFRFQVIGEKGLLDFDMFEHLDLGIDGQWERVWQQPKIDYIKEPDSPVRLEAHAAVSQEFANSILEGRRPRETGEDGRAAVAMCEAALLSARRSRAVEMTEVL
ncbi:MAG: Gfo/Idh/MocA family oxidoreductase [Chloroflexi bacterium]|nr:Gfo/Idh/MocA family oxidoreductase [Chloroflexota bacterium]